MSASTSTIDALNTLCTSIPEWKSRLDELNGQIAQRQLELARLTQDRPPTARSVRNKGSTESLRPKDEDENRFLATDTDQTDGIQINPFESPNSNQIGPPPIRTPASSAAARATAVKTPPPAPKANSNTKSSPSALNRQFSQPTPPVQARISPGVLRKRKTESLASAESLAPKYRTRSMIIVYYDSAVQTAFEELVKFVSGSRNAMRKGKMAAKMAEMRRAAELEVEGDDDGDDVDGEGLFGLVANIGALSGSQKDEPRIPGIPKAVDLSEGPDADAEIPKLRFVSTRQMGPSRNHVRPSDIVGSSLSLGMLKGYGRRGDTVADIFDTLDKALEWCQSQCEHAAHQFLRDGECNTEIENIKGKLGEVKDMAEKEVERLRQEEASSPTRPLRRVAPEEGKGRELKSVQMRRDIGALKDLEVDDSLAMEVDDDEGVDDLEQPTLVFKRSRDIGR